MSDEKSLIAEVKALDLQAGNFLVLRTHPQATPAEIQLTVDQIRPHIPQGCQVAVLVGDADMSTLDEKSMNAIGWVAAEQRDELQQALERLLDWHAAIYGDDCEYTGDHPLAVAKAAIAKTKGGAV